MYDLLYDSWLKEKEYIELQSLPKDFYTKLTEYIAKIQKQKRMLDRNSPKSRLISQEFSRVKRLMRELIELRFKKIVVIAGADEILKGDLLMDEEEALRKLRATFERFQFFVDKVLQGKKLKINFHNDPTRSSLLRFLKEVPAVVGSDFNVYGPFSVEDVAAVPAENAKVLIKHGVATRIEIT